MLDENGVPVYNTVQDILRSAMAECVSYLDNYTGANDTMHRQRVKVADGQYRWVQGKTHDELNDAIVKAYIESGRITEFLGVAPLKPAIRTGFRELAEKWFTTYKSNLKPTSRNDYRYMLDSVLYPAFSERTIQDITLSDIQEFLNGRKTTAKSTLKKSIIVLGQLFDLAIREELLEKSPLDKKLLKYPSDIVHERNALTRDEFDEIVAGIPKLKKLDDRRLLALFCFTGMRRGEIAGLRWEDIDFEHKLIHIMRNVTYPENEPIIGTPKSKKGFRTIPLDDRLLVYLTPSKAEGFVLGGERPYKRSKFQSVWRCIGKVIDLHGATFHVFRHTYATMLNNAGVDVKTIQTIMGHANIGATMIYTHITDENIIEAGMKYAALTKSSSAQPS